MYTISFGSKFKRDFKTVQKRGYPINQIVEVFQFLENEGKLPVRYLSHKLSGNYINCWECHIRPDWLLIWEKDEILKEIKLIRTGTHSDLF
ncbi:MAG: type II toxin-antitoxin system YafQ family toxin [Candidatus Saccharibacteria bacterium]